MFRNGSTIINNILVYFYNFTFIVISQIVFFFNISLIIWVWQQNNFLRYQNDISWTNFVLKQVKPND